MHRLMPGVPASPEGRLGAHVKREPIPGDCLVRGSAVIRAGRLLKAALRAGQQPARAPSGSGLRCNADIVQGLFTFRDAGHPGVAGAECPRPVRCGRAGRHIRSGCNARSCGKQGARQCGDWNCRVHGTHPYPGSIDPSRRSRGGGDCRDRGDPAAGGLSVTCLLHDKAVMLARFGSVI